MEIETVRCWSGGGPQNEVWNWGDAISPLVFELVSGKKPNVIDYKNLSTDPHLMICGSTLKWATSGSVLWGVGEIAENMHFVQGDVKPLHVAAVRGPLTREKLLSANIPCPEIFCDPAFVLSTYLKPTPSPKKYRIGVIPHYIDQGLPILAHLDSRDDVRVIDITQKDVPEDKRIYSFIDEVCSCDMIISSSLHGIILADAYGIPSKWMVLSDKVFGGDFKFRDYFLSVNQGERVLSPLKDISNVNAVIEAVQRDFAKYGRAIANVYGYINAFPGDAHQQNTDTKRWREVADAVPPWDRRNVMISKYIPSDSTVIDFGAGNQTIRDHAHVENYTAIDCVQGEKDVFLCDYNVETKFPSVTPDVIVMSGFLEYVVQTADFLNALKQRYPGARCVFSWAFDPQDPIERQRSGWVSEFTPENPEDAPFKEYFQDLTVLEEYKTPYSRQLIYQGFL